MKTTSCESRSCKQEKKRRRTYTGAFKAEVVFEAMKEKKSLGQLAEQFGLHPNQIKNWKSALRKNAADLLEDRRRKTTSPGSPENRN